MKLLLSAASLMVAVTMMPVMATADPIKERKDLMKTYKDSASLVGKMAKGKEPYAADKVAAAMKQITSTTEKFVTLYPEGSEPDPKSDSKYYATDDVWLNMEGFKEKSVALKDAATKVAATTSFDELKAAAGGLFKSCKGCHETYRAKR